MKHKRFVYIGIILISFCLCIVLFLNWRNRSRNYIIHFTLPQVTSASVDSIRVGTYNVKSLNMGHSLEAFVKDIKDKDIDILCLQEVDEHIFRSKNMKMVEEMAKAAGYMYYYFYQTIWMANGYYGLGILSKYPIEQVASVQLPNSLIQEARILANAVININGEKWNIYNTHIGYRTRQNHYDQLQYLKQKEYGKRTLLMGDFNTFHEEEFFSIDNMRSINWNGDDFKTFKDFGKPDNIFYSSDVKVGQAQMIRTSFSDHHLLYCDVILP